MNHNNIMGERSPIWNTGARGVLSGLSLPTTKGAIVRAILEGSAFALRHNLEVAARTGLAIDALRSVGGGARSKLWRSRLMDWDVPSYCQNRQSERRTAARCSPGWELVYCQAQAKRLQAACASESILNQTLRTTDAIPTYTRFSVIPTRD